MDSLDTFVHPQAWAAGLAVLDLSLAWVLATAAVVGLIRERRRNRAGEVPNAPVARRARFA
jgi:hypothetical protein